MQAIILAGGRGTRLRPHTEEIPKPLLTVNGKAILGHQIETLTSEGVSPIIIVTGFLAEKIIAYTEENFPEVEFIFIHNAEFESSKPAFGIIKALPNINSDTIYLNGDVRYDPKILREVIHSKMSSTTAVQKTAWDEEEVNVVIDASGYVTELSKNLSSKESCGEFIGITKLGTDFISAIKEIVEKEGVETFRHSFAIDLLNHVIHQTSQKIFAIDVTQFKAIEIDTPKDLQDAEDRFKI